MDSGNHVVRNIELSKFPKRLSSSPIMYPEAKYRSKEIAIEASQIKMNVTKMAIERFADFHTIDALLFNAENQYVLSIATT
jgi:hypothetical protein